MEENNMQVAILCGGKSTRMGSHVPPKALSLIGRKPLLWHIMRLYSRCGFGDFILCLGHKGGEIQKTLSPLIPQSSVQFVPTGLSTNTGGRLKKIQRLITEDTFLATYGDGLANIPIRKLLKFHKSHKKIATITVVKPRSPFGVAKMDRRHLVTRFDEKPQLTHWINGGFFVFSRRIFDYLRGEDVLETDTFNRLIRDKQLCAFRHTGFWKCMDTHKDYLELNDLWKTGKAPWETLPA